MENDELKSEFHQAMLQIYSVVAEETGYQAIRYLQKVRNRGGLDAAKDWLRPRSTPLAGLQRLTEMHRLDLSFESLILQEKWAQLFTEQELSVARHRLNIAAGSILPEELILNSILTEGAKQQITVNVYEPNLEARRKCIAHYGTRCIVCEEDLKNKYGEVADGFIHVHHLKPLHTIGESYVLQ